MKTGIILIVAACLLLLAGCTTPMDEETAKAYATASKFIMNEGTYAFDGIDGTLKMAGSEKISDVPLVWEMTLTFDSAHEGYGNRAGKALMKWNTPHTVQLVVANDEVSSALMDGKWDMVAGIIVDVENKSSPEGGFCGGIANVGCEQGLECVLEGDWQYVGGKCMESKEIAIVYETASQFIMNEGTYAFDGINGTIEMINYSRMDPTSDIWEIAFRFETLHPGHGNRSGKNISFVRAPHTALIVVANEQVSSAVMDNEWDMIAQREFGTSGNARPSSYGEYCGGIADIPCASGLECVPEGDWQNAGGRCVRS